MVPNTPGQTQVVASASGVSSQPYIAETCPVQCISPASWRPNIGQTSFIANKGRRRDHHRDSCRCSRLHRAQTAADLDFLGSPRSCRRQHLPPVAPPAHTCAISTAQPGAAAITASCTPPTCNIGFPLNSHGPSCTLCPATGLSRHFDFRISDRRPLSRRVCWLPVRIATAIRSVPSRSMISQPPRTSPPARVPCPRRRIRSCSIPRATKLMRAASIGALLITVANLGSTSSSPFTALPATGTTSGIGYGQGHCRFTQRRV